MTKYLFYLKECLFNPAVFFKYQNDTPSIIQTPWIIIPLLVFILFSIVHWLSNTVTIHNLDYNFELFIIVHIEHIIVGFFLMLFIWLRTWITLRFFGKIRNRTYALTACCNTPYVAIFLLLIFVFLVYMPFVPKGAKVASENGPIISSIQHGASMIRGAVLFSDIWTILLIFRAVSIINPIKGKASLIGGIIIFLLPSFALITFR